VKDHPYACVESMTRFSLPKGFTVRVWRDQTNEQLTIRWMNLDLQQAYVDWCSAPGEGELDLMNRLAAVPGVNAVEIVDGMGYGTVIYPTWP
jgi:hypothetical protein